MSAEDVRGEVADVLSKAADLIEERGWAQGCLFRDAEGREVLPGSDDKKCFCAAGAIVEVGGSRYSRAWDYLDSLLPAAEGNRTAVWNDAPGRTQAEIVQKLRAAAALARSGE